MSVIKDVAFHINPYDTFMANKDINGKQCTIYWYIVNNKVLYVEQEVFDVIIKNMEGIFMVLTVTKGNTHTFLGTNMRHLMNNRVVTDMQEDILETVQKFGEDVS